jgi:hypothetical protein
MKHHLPRLRSIATSVMVAVSLGAATEGSAQDQTRLDGLLYVTLLDYSGSMVKQDGYVAGFYSYFGYGPRHGFEAGATRTHIDYVDGTSLNQNDVSVAYTHLFPKASLRLGAHIIDTQDPPTDGGVVLFGSVGPLIPYVWNANVQVAYSRYPNFDGGLGVLQLSPGVGLNFGDATGTRFLYAQVRGHYVRLLDEVVAEDGAALERNLASMQTTVDYFHGPVTLSGFVWSGEQSFAVRQAGFTAFNLSEKHTGGYGGSLKVALGSKASLSVGLYNERFRDIGFVEDVSLSVYNFSFGFTL